MSLANIFQIKREEKSEVIKKLIQKSYPGTSFYIMVFLASSICAIGLILDNLAIIIGSMLVAPLLYPIIFLGMSVVLHNFEIITRTFLIITKLSGLVVLIGFLSVILFNPFLEIDETGIFYETGVLPLFYVAIASGLAATFSISRKQMEEFLPGVAISIALLPPLTNVGVSFGLGNLQLAVYSLQIFIINIFGIIFASILVFSLMGFVFEKNVAAESIEEEKIYLKKGVVEFEQAKEEEEEENK